MPWARLFDVSTSLAWRGAHAVGIVRTERELVARLLDDPDLAVLPVVFHGGTLRVLEPDWPIVSWQLTPNYRSGTYWQGQLPPALAPRPARQLVQGDAGQPPVANIQTTEQSADLSLMVYPDENDVFFCAGLGLGCH